MTVTTSGDVVTASSAEQEQQEKRTNIADLQLAQAAGVSEATAARAKALIEKRPDLADQVQASEIMLNEATRQMKKAEVAHKAGALPEGKFRVIYADPPWKYSSRGSGIDQYGPAARTERRAAQRSSRLRG
ncbi:MAG: hypothetical protein HYZ72_02995 [Deltaproteobacteria bacterium]|nr:hypothetical protein [Deltaproteobacteria bacterium]